jgi:hypothetical protein
MSYVRLARTGKKRMFFGDIVRSTYDVVQKTYYVVYYIVYDVALTRTYDWQEQVKNVCFLAISYVVRTMSSKKRTM